MTTDAEHGEQVRRRLAVLNGGAGSCSMHSLHDRLPADLARLLARAEQAEERIAKARAACVPLGHLATGVLGALNGGEMPAPDWTAVRDAVGEDHS